MNDSVNTLVPAVAAVIVLVVGITAAIKPQRISPGVLWWVPALLSAAFFVGLSWITCVPGVDAGANLVTGSAHES